MELKHYLSTILKWWWLIALSTAIAAAFSFYASAQSPRIYQTATTLMVGQALQSPNPDNIQAHYASTGPEIWEQTEGRIDAFIDAQGTGGTLTGVAKFLKEQHPGVQILAIEPEECPILAGGGWGPHKIEGIGDGFIPDNLHLDLLDAVVEVSSDEAIEMARRLAREACAGCSTVHRHAGVPSGLLEPLVSVAAPRRIVRFHHANQRAHLRGRDT